MVERLLYREFPAFLQNERGSVLAAVLILTTVILLSGMGFLSLYMVERSMGRRHADRVRAFYLAEGGIQQALWRMRHTRQEDWGQWATFSEPNVVVLYDSVALTLTATGTVGGIAKTVTVQISVGSADSPMDHVISYTTSFKESGHQGQLIYDPENAPEQFEELPGMEWAYYQSIADFVYTPTKPKKHPTQTFSGPLPDGIHFVNGDVEVKKNTTLQGTIIATGSITLSQKNISIEAQQVPPDSPYFPAYYPALIAAQAIQSHGHGPTVYGAVLSEEMVDFDAAEVHGLLVSPSVRLQGKYTVAYDEQYRYRPPGLDLGAWSSEPIIVSWSEE